MCQSEASPSCFLVIIYVYGNVGWCGRIDEIQARLARENCLRVGHPLELQYEAVNPRARAAWSPTAANVRVPARVLGSGAIKLLALEAFG